MLAISLTVKVGLSSGLVGTEPKSSSASDLPSRQLCYMLQRRPVQLALRGRVEIHEGDCNVGAIGLNVASRFEGSLLAGSARDRCWSAQLLPLSRKARVEVPRKRHH